MGILVSILRGLRVSQCSPNDDEFLVEFELGFNNKKIKFHSDTPMTLSEACKITKELHTWSLNYERMRKEVRELSDRIRELVGF